MKKKILLFLIVVCPIWAKSPQTPAQIRQKLSSAQQQLNVAKEMFNPHYAGPLLTGSANNTPVGEYIVQGYVFSTLTYAVFNNSRHSKSIKNIFTLNPQFLFMTGITDWLDFEIAPQLISNFRGNESSTNIGDLPVEFGIQVQDETPHLPAIRIALTETFPLGKYQKLNPDKNGTDISGSGFYETTLSLNFSKIFWYFNLHPIDLRASFNYTYQIPSHIEGFTTYGGGFGTSGKVYSGGNFTAFGAIEYSLTQDWVFALDAVYEFQAAIRFSGKKGTLKDGIPAPVGLPSRDLFSLAPAIEYNPKANMNFLAGFWFPVTGRNSLNFISLVVSMAYSW